MTVNPNSYIPDTLACSEYADIQLKLAESVGKIPELQAISNLSGLVGLSNLQYNNLPNPFVGIELFEEEKLRREIFNNHRCGKLWSAKRCDAHKQDRLNREIPAKKTEHKKKCDEAAQAFDLLLQTKKQGVQNVVLQNKAENINEPVAPANQKTWWIIIGFTFLVILFLSFKVFKKGKP